MVSSEANATNKSGGEAEIAGGVGMWCGAATRSLRSACGAAHSGVDARKASKDSAVEKGDRASNTEFGDRSLETDYESCIKRALCWARFKESSTGEYHVVT
jgi:hypothetical protein